ncbi:hypothetical protein OG948_35975 (plasmid) [Embleya sp. NBC_00888]|uniref:hypothetical protein n=1 Tax=Embleya sp. NBC_00888 TaxID=2975960 RepID=UPI00386F2679|nr:hypothetical protein OG948_35975 [Embleya sp. NBC_00888]
MGLFVGVRENRRVAYYARGAVVSAVVDSHPSYGVMVCLPNGERALLEREFLEPAPRDPGAGPARAHAWTSSFRDIGPGVRRWFRCLG